jgi:TM2 domain-containing membrane protein YozV
VDRSAFYGVFFDALDAIPAEKRLEFEIAVMPRLKNPVIIFGASVWLGWIGLDRFLLGQIWVGVLKLITFGGLGIWWIIDLFLVSGSARRINAEAVREVRAALTGGVFTGRAA